MKKAELNYNIIREALGEYLNNTNVIPMYNKKQIKEEAYKLEDLENSKAFISDRNPREKLRVDVKMCNKQILFDIINCFTKQSHKPTYLASGTIYSNKTKQKFELIETYVDFLEIGNQKERIADIIWVIEELLHAGNIRNNITKDQVQKLVVATENLPNNE